MIYLVIGTKKGEDNYWVIAAFKNEDAAVEYKDNIELNTSFHYSVMSVPLMNHVSKW